MTPRNSQARSSIGAGDDALRARARRAVHEPRLGGLAAERERRQRLGADVEGEQLQDGQRQRDRAAAEREDQERRHLGRGVGEDVEDELADVVVDPPARPTATTIVAKLSSVSTIVEASRATSVPERPIATPMSARRSAGASLTPSPVIATTWPSARSASAIRSFASGELRAKISSRSPCSSVVELGLAHAVELARR